MFFGFFFCYLLVGQKGGCIIVDSTRRGKRFPDSMSKTIPIWTCVLNRSVFNYLNKSRNESNDDGSLLERVSIGNILCLKFINFVEFCIIFSIVFNLACGCQISGFVFVEMSEFT